MNTDRSFDFVIVGSGAGGAVLAKRLSARPDVRVLLLEAGPHCDVDPRVDDPAQWANLQGGDIDWAFRSSPQPNLADREIPIPRGRVLGGSTAMNAMLWLRGDRRDFDTWKVPGWSADELWPSFDHTESTEDGLGVTRLTGRHPWSAAFVEAALDTGYGYNRDFSHGNLSGAGCYTVSRMDGRRRSAWSGYLKPVADRSNLTILTGATALRVLLHGDRVTTVEYLHDGRRHTAAVEREVLLAAGVLGSPQLLRASGIGPGQALHDHGVTPLLDLPGVGENLHDHVAVSVTLTAARPDPATARSGLGETGLFVGNGSLPRFHLWLGTSTDPAGRTFTLAAGLTKPASRGRINWRDDGTPIPDPGYLTAHRDRDDLAEALSAIAELADSSALRSLTGDALPTVLTADTSTRTEYIRDHAGTQFHLVGSCRMGTDELAVVGPDLRVRGLTNLRIVDASILPEITSGGPQAPVYAIAEHAARLLPGT